MKCTGNIQWVSMASWWSILEKKEQESEKEGEAENLQKEKWSENVMTSNIFKLIMTKLQLTSGLCGFETKKGRAALNCGRVLGLSGRKRKKERERELGCSVRMGAVQSTDFPRESTKIKHPSFLIIHRS